MFLKLLVILIYECIWWRKWQPTLVLLPGKIPCMQESGGPHSLGLQWVGHNLATKHQNTGPSTFADCKGSVQGGVWVKDTVLQSSFICALITWCNRNTKIKRLFSNYKDCSFLATKCFSPSWKWTHSNWNVFKFHRGWKLGKIIWKCLKNFEALVLGDIPPWHFLQDCVVDTWVTHDLKTNLNYLFKASPTMLT